MTSTYLSKAYSLHIQYVTLDFNSSTSSSIMQHISLVIEIAKQSEASLTNFSTMILTLQSDLSNVLNMAGAGTKLKSL
jgi:hypothetical protein